MNNINRRSFIAKSSMSVAALISSHLSDWTSDKKQVPIGKGVIDWKEFFAAAKTGGVKSYFVEMDFNTLDESVKYVLAKA